MMLASRMFGGPTLADALLARHQLIDARLTEQIESGRITQVVEIAAGMSPRGYRFTTKYPHLTYVEADLPGMADRKRRALSQLAGNRPGHRVEICDALLPAGTTSVAGVLSRLDHAEGIVVITEDLLNYLPVDDVSDLWLRVSTAMASFPAGTYFSDLVLSGTAPKALEVLSNLTLGTLVRSGTHLHYRDADEVRSALVGGGFSRPAVLNPEGQYTPADVTRHQSARFVRIVEAHTGAGVRPPRSPADC